MFENVKWKENGKLKLMIIVGTRPEIIRLAAVINKCRKYFDTLLVHTGQNYDYTLNGVFFKDLKLDDPDVYLDAVGKDLGETMGNIIAKSYELMAEVKPEGVLVLGDTNSHKQHVPGSCTHLPSIKAPLSTSEAGDSMVFVLFLSLSFMEDHCTKKIKAWKSKTVLPILH